MRSWTLSSRYYCSFRRIPHAEKGGEDEFGRMKRSELAAADSGY